MSVLHPGTQEVLPSWHSFLRPRTQEVLPRWLLSVVLKVQLKPPFAINESDRNPSLELLSCKFAFLVALTTGPRGSELVAFSRATYNLGFKTLDSGAKQGSIRMVPKFILKEPASWPYSETVEIELIPKPLEFPGIAHLFQRILKERKRIHNRNFLCISPRSPSSSLPTSDAG